jgi:hypothetical protein
MATLAQLRKKVEPRLTRIAQRGFEADLVCACFDNLAAAGPLRFNNFAYALRELLRHVFHRLAPDDDVRASPWYTPDPRAATGITRSHRAKYMVQGGLSEFFVKNKLGVDIAPVLAELSTTYDVLNSFTHIGPSTFGLPARKVQHLAEQCLGATDSLLESVAECRASVLENLSAAIDEHLLNQVLAETITELDELATHHFVDEISVESSRILDIGSRDLTLAVEGSVGVELQYGSGSDVSSGFGQVMSESFPLTATLNVRFEKPLGKHATVEDFEVDTRSWYQ